MIQTKLRRIVVGLMMVVSLVGIASVATTPTAYAAGSGCSDRFLTFPTWYRGLTDSSCSLKSPSDLSGKDKNGAKLQRYIIIIVLNIIEIALQLVAYVSAGFIIYGGFKFLTAASDSNKVVGGRKTIQNALIGLVLAFASIAIVNLIAGNIL